MINNCPGQDPKKLEAKNIKCPSCGYEIEIFSDEVKACCPKCKSMAYLCRMPSCIDWCKKAEDCVGQEYYKRHTESKSFFLKDKLIKELEGYFGDDIKRIAHAKKVMEFAEEILRKEGGSWHIVVPAAILHDVGIKIAEQKYGSSAGHLQEKEGPAVARNILVKLLSPRQIMDTLEGSVGLKEEEIEEICRIIGSHHSPGKINSLNFGIILDADWLVNLAEIKEKKERDEIINRVFATKTAREIAKKIYL